MMNSQLKLASVSNPELLVRTHQLVAQSRRVEADLVAHLGEIDERRLYRERAFPSMFALCVGEFGFSEEAAYNRIMVARAGRRLPAVIDALRSGRVHLGGLRLLVPHLTGENHVEVLAQAAGKTKREIEEIVARFSPKPDVPSLVRKVQDPGSRSTTESLTLPPDSIGSPAAPLPRREESRPVVAPLSEVTFKVQFTASRALHDKMREAQALLRHRVPDGDFAAIFERALDVFIEQVKKERFGVGAKPRLPRSAEAARPSSRHVPNQIKRVVYERDEGRCTFTDDRGRRCAETGGLEFDHVDGFARTHSHHVDRIRLLCRAHNQHEAEITYGRRFMERARATTRPGPSSQPTLF